MSQSPGVDTKVNKLETKGLNISRSSAVNFRSPGLRLKSEIVDQFRRYYAVYRNLCLAGLNYLTPFHIF